ncbi:MULTISPECIES: DUF2007 domain-containing protein [Myroides]|uniref:DUF2007 domain-containing protein n=1 Tax=Myroides albus TaxID=2562892 RepID=A0A6I3LN50_9FLAO|nr:MULTISPECIES: DUF2007 domain-containing protein [Myroides]MTG97415.1 DUF2007 domain-containing protein [Myroides albus]MVX35089.1 DUF2007 domain-containing protein [Myroides sp. LoEW2-1]UVD79444.1 DUF2007 domain-containing protein [Myroides albus]
MSSKKLYAGSEIMVLAVRDLLEENGIAYIIRDDIESGIAAGYGILGKAVNVFVDQNDLHRAQDLLKQNNIEE